MKPCQETALHLNRDLLDHHHYHRVPLLIPAPKLLDTVLLLSFQVRRRTGDAMLKLAQ